jgi:hypothetical protein
VTMCYECGDETSGSCVTELVSVCVKSVGILIYKNIIVNHNLCCFRTVYVKKKWAKTAGCFR